MLLVVTGVFWFINSILFLLTSNVDSTLTKYIVSLLLLINSAGFFLLLYGFLTRKSWTNISAIVFLLLNIVLTITNDFGMADFGIIIIYAITLIIFIMNIKSVTKKK
ncbi:MAG: hypothetical protein Q8P90_05545 [bacterium]|nr:hypothetical protein [bacterium]